MITEILSGLWIGSVEDIDNKDFFIDNLIDISINCTINHPFFEIENMKKIRLAIKNIMDPYTDLQLLKDNKKKILEFIDINLKKNNNIFIYCYDGLTISPLIISLYLKAISNNSNVYIRDILKSKNKAISLDYDLDMF